MSSRKRESTKERPSFAGRRSFFAACVLADLALGLVLDHVVLPRAEAHFQALDLELAGIASLGVALGAFVSSYLWPIVAASVALIVLAWCGMLDKVLEPGIVLALSAVLVIGGIAAGTWNVHANVFEAVQRAAADF